MDKLYRYEIGSHEEDFSPVLKIIELPVISETKCGYWVSYFGAKKLVLKGSKFASTTVNLALKSFFLRRRNYNRILKHRIEANEQIIGLAKKEMEANDGN